MNTTTEMTSSKNIAMMNTRTVISPQNPPRNATTAKGATATMRTTSWNKSHKQKMKAAVRKPTAPDPMKKTVIQAEVTAQVIIGILASLFTC
jgi:hypothetical protein